MVGSNAFCGLIFNGSKFISSAVRLVSKASVPSKLKIVIFELMRCPTSWASLFQVVDTDHESAEINRSVQHRMGCTACTYRMGCTACTSFSYSPSRSPSHLPTSNTEPMKNTAQQPVLVNGELPAWLKYGPNNPNVPRGPIENGFVWRFWQEFWADDLTIILPSVFGMFFRSR